jgi:Dolichyl-phosphate-mannose-protein mannosyltransferase
MLAGSAVATGTPLEGVPAGGGVVERARAALANAYALGIAALTGGVAVFLLFQLNRWPPHEDETLALFVSRQPLGELVNTVLGERGGAPLHFLLSHAVASVWPSLTAIRLISVVFAVASIPVIAALAARLTDRRTALVATAIAAASWLLLYHGLYARMYSLFLFTSALSFLLFLRALERQTPRRWAAWVVTTLVTIAVQPYGAFVLAIQAGYAVARDRRRLSTLRGPAVAFASVLVLAVPLWASYRLLADRFDVGITQGGGSRLGSPVEIFLYLGDVMGDVTAGWLPFLLAIGAVALVGFVHLWRTRRGAALLAAAVLLVPALALVIVRSRGSVGLESRHLIFALPFLAILVAVGLQRLAALAGRRAQLALTLGVAGLVAAQVAWGWTKTPAFYAGEPEARSAARDRASDWLAATTLADDVLLGYEPLYLDAWSKGGDVGTLIVPRADYRLAIDTLAEAEKPLGRGVWVFDASDHADPANQRLSVPELAPADDFEARAFGPFLVLRSKEPVETPAEFFRYTMRAELLGWALGIGDAALNYQTAAAALRTLVYPD